MSANLQLIRDLLQDGVDASAIIRVIDRLIEQDDSKPVKGIAVSKAFPEADEIIRRIAKEYGTTVATIKGRRRAAPIVAARWAAISAVRDAYPEITLIDLGRLFNRDHTSIIHVFRKMGEAA